MPTEFNYNSVPYGFAHCFNQQCIKCDKCLHHLVAENCTSQYPTLPVINPNCIPADTATCPYFKSNQRLHMAWGIKHYRFYRLEQALTPKEQAYIRQVFKQNGITEEPQFERFSDEYYYND